MAVSKSNPAMEFIVDSLKSNRSAAYKDIAEAAAKKKLKIYPIMFGRAQALLGIVKAAPRGQGKAAKAAKAKAAKSAAPAVAAAPSLLAPVKRGPGRPRKNPLPAPAFDGTLEGIVAAVKGSEQAKARYHAALSKIQAILADVLA
ncbi:MAG: hypothetical protein FJ306_04415 [Planctomycetes bacterium]|nr:hypothetical protein [Planctomycetota bacterium]